MPAPLVLAPLAGPAAHAAAAQAAAAASAAAPYASALSSSTLAAVLARSLWNRLPPWVRDDPAFRSFSRRRKSSNSEDDDEADRNSDDDDEMTNLASVIRKLDEMVSSGSNKLGTKLKPAQLHAAVLAYVQLSNQLRLRHPDARDRLYAKSSPVGGSRRHHHSRVTDDGTNSSSNSSIAASADDEEEADLLSRDELIDLRQSLDYATWSYIDYYGPDAVRDKLESVEYYLHSYKLSNVPGQVGHYVAISPERKTVLIGIKGTSTLEDLVTDAAGKAVGWDVHAETTVFGNGAGGAGEGEGRGEAGMSIEVTDSSHETVVVTPLGIGTGTTEEVQHGRDRDEEREQEQEVEGIEIEICRGECIIVTSDGATVRCHEGILLSARRLLREIRNVVSTLCVGELTYNVLIVGHSLGAGVGAILGVLLRSALPSLVERDAVRVHAFAPPPVLDVDGSMGCETIVTTVVNNADVIPRGSVANLAVLLELLTVINGKLEERGMGLGGPKRAAALLRKLSQGTGGDMLMSWQEVRDLVEEAHHKIDLRDPDHLYVPGRVLLMYDPWEERDRNKSRAQRDETKIDPDEEGASSREEQVFRTDGAVRCVVTYGTAAPLRLFEVDALRMITDHLTTSHEAGLDCLIGLKG